jgi:glycosyltransferase involved in cell wall biosynthesis
MTAGVIFFEDTNLPDAREICGSYDLIVTGATWCEEVLRERGVENVATVIQGVDLSTFHPAPRAHHLRDRFTIFSGGKMEHRKGQDLVILAFRAFAQRHPEALLVTAWHSPWSTPALTLNGNAHLSPVVLKEDGAIDMAGWIAANGIPADNYFDLGKIPNHQMARVVREMDVALFPNRCEGGTNLVAMECMACGIPTILSDNTGHKDLTSIEGVYRLERQGVVTPALEGIGCEGWGESDVDEIVERLEEVWSAKEESRRRGLIGAEAMARLSWRNQIGELSRVLRA